MNRYEKSSYLEQNKGHCHPENNLVGDDKKFAEKKELKVEGEWASLKGKGGVGGRHVGVKLSFKKSNPEIRNISVSASDLIGIYK